MPRLSHDAMDARIVFRNKVNEYLGRFDRRLKQLGEDYIMEQYNEVTARGGAWAYEEIALDAFQYAIDAIRSARSVEAPADEPANAA